MDRVADSKVDNDQEAADRLILPLLGVVRLLARQAAREAITAASSSDASAVNHEPEDRP